MKRKLIKQGHNTLTLTLPRKWCEAHSLKAGDELGLEEEGSRLVVLPPGLSGRHSSIELDLSGLDRSALLFIIREAYRKGYDELKINFSNQLTPRFRDGKPQKTLSYIHYEVDRLIGYEVVEERENSCIVRDISEGSEREFEPVLRRVFLLVVSTFQDLHKGLTRGDMELISTIEEKHDTITKFASYCMRLLSKNIYNYSRENNLELYHVLAQLDLIADFMKYVSREVAEQKIKCGRTTHLLFAQIEAILQLFYKLFFDYSPALVVDFNRERYELLRGIRKATPRLKPAEALVVNRLEGIVEILNDLVRSKISLELKSN